MRILRHDNILYDQQVASYKKLQRSITPDVRARTRAFIEPVSVVVIQSIAIWWCEDQFEEQPLW